MTDDWKGEGKLKIPKTERRSNSLRAKSVTDKLNGWAPGPRQWEAHAAVTGYGQRRKDAGDGDR